MNEYILIEILNIFPISVGLYSDDVVAHVAKLENFAQSLNWLRELITNKMVMIIIIIMIYLGWVQNGEDLWGEFFETSVLL